MKIKMCGLRRPDDIIYANECLPDYIGFVFAESRRKVSGREAKKLGEQLDPSIKKVGVFVNEPLRSLISISEEAGLDIIQLHGDEGEEYIKEVKHETGKELWKAVRVRMVKDIQKHRDSRRISFCWTVSQKSLMEARGKSWILRCLTRQNPETVFYSGRSYG